MLSGCTEPTWSVCMSNAIESTSPRSIEIAKEIIYYNNFHHNLLNEAMRLTIKPKVFKK